MRTQALLGLPIVFLSSGCTMGARLGPELRSQPNGSVLEARGTVVAGIGDAGSDHRGGQLTVPLSFSVGEGLSSGEREGSFETGIELTQSRSRFGYRLGPRVGMGLGATSGTYLGIRGGPLLMLSPPEEGEASLSLMLEGMVGAGVGGDMSSTGVFGIGLSVGLDLYPEDWLRIPSGRPLRDEQGGAWTGEAGLGRCAPIRLGRQLRRDDRERLAMHYVHDGLQELASIASFERLAGELAVLDAPRALILSARTAARDEARHARYCFALASAYLGREIRAPRLPSGEPRRDRSLLDLARESWFDGCLGEGSAAALLFARAEHATEILVRRTLSSIARDEKRHAALGADILRWCAKRVLGAEPTLQSTVG
ncbi:MAG TPA: ferritin-like domain-containing protein [Polyangiaceae bacterium]|nr:ferritin-like domain-containing protein [Polyangiaceae bacterium]